MFANVRAKHLVGLVLVIVPLVVFLSGIAGLTWFRPSSLITFSAPPLRAQTVMSGKNVLESTGETVTIIARGDKSQRVFLAVGLTSDVQAFAQSTNRAVLADFAGSGRFKILRFKKKPNFANSEHAAAAKTSGTQSPARPPATDNPDPKTLDIWQQTSLGKGQAQLRWNLSDSRWSAIAFNDETFSAPPPATAKTGGTNQSKTPTRPAKTPELQLKWHRQPSLATAWSLTIIGALALFAVLAYITLSLVSEMRSQARRQESEEKEKTIRLAAEVVGEIESLTHPRRRALRHARNVARLAQNTPLDHSGENPQRDKLQGALLNPDEDATDTGQLADTSQLADAGQLAQPGQNPETREANS